jgi:uncharacterized YigZ family protein
LLFSNSYKTISSEVQAEFKDKGSRFIAFAYPVTSEIEAKEKINHLKKEHPSANHHCWALVLGNDREFQKSSDDREPNNTAGKPILRAIIGSDLSFVLVVVVRYFGGKLLGVPGLIHAYGTAALEAISIANIIEKEITEKYLVPCRYEEHPDLYRILKNSVINLQVTDIDVLEQGLIFEVSKQKVGALLIKLKEARFDSKPI